MGHGGHIVHHSRERVFDSSLVRGGSLISYENSLFSLAKPLFFYYKQVCTEQELQTRYLRILLIRYVSKASGRRPEAPKSN